MYTEVQPLRMPKLPRSVEKASTTRLTPARVQSSVPLGSSDAPGGAPSMVLVGSGYFVTGPLIPPPTLTQLKLSRTTFRPGKRSATVTYRISVAAKVTFRVPTDMLGFTGMDGRRVVEPGEFEIMVGASSADLPLKATITLTGAAHYPTGKWRMESSLSAT